MKNIIYGLIACLVLAVSGCEDDDEAPLSIGFLETSATDSEAGGSKSAALQLNRVSDGDIQIDYNITGNAALSGDYRFTAPSADRILAGNTTLEFIFELIDDPIIEDGDKVIELNITAATGLAVSPDEPLVYTFTITDNDALPDNGLQIDLTWDLGAGVDIDNVNLDLLLATDVVAEGNVITGFNLDQNSSENLTGYESILIDNNAADGEYYAVIFYNSGEGDVTFGLSLHSQGSESSTTDGSLTENDVESAIFFGPIVKNGAFTSNAARVFINPEPVGNYPFSGKVK